MIDDRTMRLFCGDGSAVQCPAAPFVRGGYTYATDGRVIIRTPTPDADDTAGKFPECNNLPFGREVAGWVDVPDAPLFTIDEYRDAATGAKHAETKAEIVRIGAASMSPLYIALLHTLPGARIEEKPPDERSPVRFVFSWGDGLLMPLRPGVVEWFWPIQALFVRLLALGLVKIADQQTTKGATA